jgi:hypothetical protein
MSNLPLRRPAGACATRGREDDAGVEAAGGFVAASGGRTGGMAVGCETTKTGEVECSGEDSGTKVMGL